VFPIKVNQERCVVEDTVSCASEHHLDVTALEDAVDDVLTCVHVDAKQVVKNIGQAADRAIEHRDINGRREERRLHFCRLSIDEYPGLK